MIKYAWVAVLLCALAGCGNTRQALPGDQQDEVNDDALSQEQQQPMLIRAYGSTSGAVRCTHAVDPPIVRYGRVFSRQPLRFGSRGRRVAADGTVIREIRLEVSRFGFSPSVMVFKRGERVRLLVTSRDVLHGVSLKEYGISVPVRRGEMRIIEFVADTAGQFVVRCPLSGGRARGQPSARIIVEE